MKKIIKMKRITFLFGMIALLCISQAVFSFDYGAVSITQSSSAYWKTRSFTPHWYPIVIMDITTYNNSEPYALRLNGSNMGDIDFQIDEWNYLDGTHPLETGNFVVFDLGSTTVEGMAVSANYPYLDHEWQTFNFTHPAITYSEPPVILAQCVDNEGADAVTIRIRNVTTTSYEIKLQEEEAGGAHTTERVNVVVLPVGTYGNFEIKKVNGITDSWFQLNDLSRSNAIVLGNIQTYNGADTANVRIYKSGTSAYVKLAEEQSADQETTHTQETVGLLIYYY